MRSYRSLGGDCAKATPTSPAQTKSPAVAWKTVTRFRVMAAPLDHRQGDVSIELHARRLYDRSPFPCLVGDEFRKIPRRSHIGFGAEPLQIRIHLRRFQALIDGRIEPVHDLPRRPCRHQNPGPGIRTE